MPDAGLTPILDAYRVVLCAGCGGVGKTTISAALALAAARRGRRVLCLTIDPARRLANALGLERMETEARVVEGDVFVRAGLEVRGSLTVMMLDTKRTFDDLVSRHAPTREVRDRIQSNRIYQHLSTRLAGTQEYMAMEKLLALERDPRFDLIVLDTPPTSNALDFLDAPERLVAALESPALRWIVGAFGQTRRLRLNMVARGAAVALRGIARLLGSGFIEQVAEFLTALDQLFGGFKERARAVSAAFRSDEFAYVLVTSPARDSIREVSFFADRLAALGMRRDAVVVNRVHRPPRCVPEPSTIERALAGRAHEFATGASTRIARAVREEVEWARRDQRSLRELSPVLKPREGSPPVCVHVPALPCDVHDVRTLAEIAALLCPPAGRFGSEPVVDAPR